MSQFQTMDCPIQEQRTRQEPDGNNYTGTFRRGTPETRGKGLRCFERVKEEGEEGFQSLTQSAVTRVTFPGVASAAVPRRLATACLAQRRKSGMGPRYVLLR
ncbi:hypothetical protein J6590_019049 [Homalodisca vitripennis]|nr:hypothetical protein J6590_019049 [Homalodisca vitripennis]